MHHSALFVEFGLINSTQQVTHTVAFEPQNLVEGAHRNILEVVGAIVIGCSVQIGTSNGFQCLEIIFVEVFRTVEHQVLEQVCKSGFAGQLIFGTHVIPDIHRYNRSLVIFMNNQAKSVGQGELFVCNINGIRVVNREILCAGRYRDEQYQQLRKKKNNAFK